MWSPCCFPAAAHLVQGSNLTPVGAFQISIVMLACLSHKYEDPETKNCTLS